jgi:hypothetical protein
MIGEAILMQMRAIAYMAPCARARQTMRSEFRVYVPPRSLILTVNK